MEEIYNSYWLPVNASAHGGGVDELITLLHYFMVVLFVGWGLFMAFCLVRFRARPGHKAEAVEKHFKLPTYLEIGVAGFEVFLLVFLSYPIWAATKSNPPTDEESVRVRVVAEQFAWSFHYPGRDGQFGTTSIDLIDSVDNPLGIDREDPVGMDDIVSVGIMYLPVNTPVKIELTAKDVIHSLGIPVMRVKQDAVPGSNFPVWFTPTMQSPESGFEIVCSQLCGIGHTRMRGIIHVTDQEGFDAWLAERHAEVVEWFGAAEADDSGDSVGDESQDETDSEEEE